MKKDYCERCYFFEPMSGLCGRWNTLAEKVRACQNKTMPFASSTFRKKWFRKIRDVKQNEK